MDGWVNGCESHETAALFSLFILSSHELKIRVDRPLANTESVCVAVSLTVLYFLHYISVTVRKPQRRLCVCVCVSKT